MSEQHRKAGRAAWHNTTSRQRSEMARKRELAKPEAVRRARGKALTDAYQGSTTKKRMADRMREIWASKTPEQRRRWRANIGKGMRASSRERP